MSAEVAYNSLDEHFFLIIIIINFKRYITILPAQVHQSRVAILHHMLSPHSAHLLDQSRPMPPLSQHEVQDHQIFINGPSTLFDIRIHVVEPMLSTLLGSLEEFSLRQVEESLGNFRPFAV